MPLSIITQEIISGSAKNVTPSAKPKTICEIFRYEPDNMEQMALGNLYIVAELNLVKDCGHLNNLLSSLIKREYYLYPEKGPFKSLQSALKKANLHLKEMAKEGNTEWLGKLHFVCAAVAGDELFFASAGRAIAYLFRQGHMTSLIKKGQADATTRNVPAKFFSSIVNGKIECEDKIIFATPLFDQFFSSSSLREIFESQKGPSSISGQLRQTLDEQSKPPSLAILTLQTKDDCEPRQPMPPQRPIKHTTEPIGLDEILN